MARECSGGIPLKNVIQKPLKAGDMVKAGQYIRVEASTALTDDDVTVFCDIFSSCLCSESEGWHVTYYYVSNTKFVYEAKATQNQTMPAELEGVVFLLQSKWEAYKIPIIIAAIIGGTAGYIALKRR
jgi:hypothetical protein